MKKFYTLITALILVMNATAQPSFQRLIPLLPGGYIDRVQFFDTLNGYAYSTFGLAKTSDGGKHWYSVQDWSYFGTYFLNKNVAFSTNSTGFLYKSTDCGQTWTKVSSNVIYGSKIFALTEQKIITYGSVYIAVTSNGGSNWTTKNFGFTTNDVCFADQNNGWIVGTNGNVYCTSDGGINWAAQNSKVTENLNDVHFINKDTGWVCGLNGRLLRTNDGGKNWIASLISNKNLNAIKFINSKKGIVSAQNEVLITFNSGQSWTSYALSIGNNIEIIDSLHIYSCTQYFIGFSSDFGKTWINQIPVQNDFQAVYFADNKNGWLADINNCKIYNTSDGGYNWSLQFDSNFYREFSCFSSFGKNIWASGLSLGVLFSKDFGSKWTKISNSSFKKIYFIDSLNGFAISYSSTTYLYKTNDTGKSWTKITLPNNSIISSFQFLDKNNGFVFIGGKILKTTNGGTTWTTVYSNSTEAIHSIYFTDLKNGWACGTNGLLVMTNDSAKSWSYLSSGTNRELYKVYFINKDTGFLSGNFNYNDSIKITFNGGQKWAGIFNVPWFELTESGFGWALDYYILYKVKNFGLPCNFITSLGSDTSVFIHDSITFSPGSAYSDYLWYDGSTASSKLVDAFSLGIGTHNIIVKVTASTGCEDIDTLKLTVKGCTKAMNIGKDTSIFNYQSITFNAGSGFTAYKWNNNATTQSINLSGASLGLGTHKIFVRAIDANSCMAGDTVLLTVKGCTFKYNGLGRDTFIYTSQKMTLKADSGYNEYTWNDKSKNRSIEVDGSKLSPGTYLYYITLRDSLNCAGIDSIKITVKACNIKVGLGNDTAFCEGNSKLLDAGKNFIKYLWNTTDSTQTVNITKSGDYNVKVIDLYGCEAFSDTVKVTVNSLPIVKLRSDTAFCADKQIPLKSGSGFSSYKWNTNETQSTITVNKTGDYFVYVTDLNGCSNYSDTVSITVFPLPLVKLGNDQAFCEGKSTTLNAGSGFSTYKWSNNGSANQHLMVTKAGHYYVFVTDQHQCSNYSDTVEITVYPLPVVNIGKDTSLCDGDVLVLEAGTQYSTYNWNNGAGSKHDFTVTKQGAYSVFVTDKNGCSDTSNTINVKYNSLPFIYLGKDTTIYDNQYLTLNAGSGFKSYKWQNNSNDSFFAVVGSMVGLGTHVYFVTVTDANNCKSTDSITVTVNKFIGIESADELKFEVYPNPAENQLILNCESTGEIQVFLTDMNGRTIKEVEIKSPVSGFNMDISACQSGVYILKLVGEGKIGYKRIVKL